MPLGRPALARLSSEIDHGAKSKLEKLLDDGRPVRPPGRVSLAPTGQQSAAPGVLADGA